MSTPGTRCWARSHLIALGHYIRPPRRQLCSDSTLSEVARPATGGPGFGNFLKRGDCGDDSFGVGRPRLRVLRWANERRLAWTLRDHRRGPGADAGSFNRDLVMKVQHEGHPTSWADSRRIRGDGERERCQAGAIR